MHQRLFAVTSILLALATTCVVARDAQKTLSDLFDELQPLAEEQPRYNHLVAATPLLARADQYVARQLLASCENELGLYSEAVRDFPLRNHLPEKMILPDTIAWKAVDAVDAIATLAENRQIVMVNEAHHDGHTRELTLLLLPRLRAMGFRYFAAEAIDAKDTSLMQRGYPVTTSGTEYLHEPLYGDIVREAIELGYIIVPYDAAEAPQQGRENGQARNLNERVFARDPRAKLFVHAGYAHIDERRGRLGSTQPMAMQLRKLTGIDPLSVDQTEIREENPNSETLAYHSLKHALQRFETFSHTIRPPLSDGPGDMPARPVADAYHQIVAAFRPAGPIALLQVDSHAPWSARPGVYDLSVILPPANPARSDYSPGPLWLSIEGRKHAVLPPANSGHRPDWLTLDGQRVDVPVDSEACARKFPCLVEAHYAAESADAIAADRYLFLRNGKNVLYLRPGAYRLRTAAPGGQTLDEHAVLVTSH